MAERVWRPAPGFEGTYEVANTGIVRNVRAGRIMRTGTGRYPRVSLRREGRYVTRTVHRLVAIAFLGDRSAEGFEVCHIDGDPRNNLVSNLRWDTHASNMSDQIAHGTHVNARKTHCKHGHRFTPENTLARKDGKRRCKTCAYAAIDRYRARETASFSAND